MNPPSQELQEFVRSIPKTETHLHLDGACPFHLIQASNPSKYQKTPASWAEDFRFSSFAEFIDYCMFYFPDYFCSAERYHAAAQGVFAECASQNVRYVETSFNISLLQFLKESGEEVVQAIKAAAPPGMEVRVFAGMCHNDYHGAVREIIDDCLNWPSLDGIDLHGFEDLPLQPWSAEIWALARQKGKYTKAHAGEFMGAEFVDLVLDQLKPQRIEHGVRSIESQAVVERLLQEGIGLDVCPISNLKLAVKGVKTLAEHPIRRLFDAGVVVTVNTDDPMIFGNRLDGEYCALYQELGFSKSELVKIAANGFKVSLLMDQQKREYLTELEELIDRHI